MSELFSSTALMKTVIMALAGICVVEALAILFLAVKKNVYYINPDGEEVAPPTKAQRRAMKEGRYEDVYESQSDTRESKPLYVGTTPERRKNAQKTQSTVNTAATAAASTAAATAATSATKTIVAEKVVPSEVVHQASAAVPADEDGYTREVEIPHAVRNVRGVRVKVVIGADSAEHTIDSLPCLMGRESGACDLKIAEPAVSRRHARLLAEEMNLYVEDVSEHNGTFVNGTKLPSLGKALLHNGDEITLGRAKIIIEKILY